MIVTTSLGSVKKQDSLGGVGEDGDGFDALEVGAHLDWVVRKFICGHGPSPAVPTTAQFPEIFYRPAGSGYDATCRGWRDVAAVAWYFDSSGSFSHERMVCAFPLFPTAVLAKRSQQELATYSADIRRHLSGDFDPDRFHGKSGGDVLTDYGVYSVGLHWRRLV